MTPKIEIVGKNFAHFGRFLGVIFDYFERQKSRYLDFFKIVLESFGKFLSIVFGLNHLRTICLPADHWIWNYIFRKTRITLC